MWQMAYLFATFLVNEKNTLGRRCFIPWQKGGPKSDVIKLSREKRDLVAEGGGSAPVSLNTRGGKGQKSTLIF